MGANRRLGGITPLRRGFEACVDNITIKRKSSSSVPFRRVIHRRGRPEPRAQHRDCSSVYKRGRILHESRKVSKSLTSGTPFRLATAFHMSFRNQQNRSDLGVFWNEKAV